MEPQPSLKIDPLELSELMQILTKKTFSVYKVTWLDFVNFAQITVDNPPKESDFYGFFTKKRDSGFCGNSIKFTGTAFVPFVNPRPKFFQHRFVSRS